MSTADRLGTDPARMRHPMGLPRGSVRALLLVMVVGLILALLALPEEENLPDEQKIHVPLYLYYLFFLIMGHYFAARGQSRSGDESPPLHLPRGSIRFILIVAVLAVVGWSMHSNPHFFDRLKPSVKDVTLHPYLPLVLLGAFFLGIVTTRIAHVVLGRGSGLPAWYQDVQAWVALLAVLGLGAEVLIHLVIYPSVEAQHRFDLPHWQSILTGIVAFYFGARS